MLEVIPVADKCAVHGLKSLKVNSTGALDDVLHTVGILVTSSIGNKQISNRIVDLVITDVEEYLTLGGVHHCEMVGDELVIGHPSAIELSEALLSSRDVDLDVMLTKSLGDEHVMFGHDNRVSRFELKYLCLEKVI